MRQNVTGLQWMASEAWTAFPVLQTPHLMPYLGGTLGIAIRRGEITGFRDFLLRIHTDLQHNNSYGNNMVSLSGDTPGEEGKTFKQLYIAMKLPPVDYLY